VQTVFFTTKFVRYSLLHFRHVQRKANSSDTGSYTTDMSNEKQSISRCLLTSLVFNQACCTVIERCDLIPLGLRSTPYSVMSTLSACVMPCLAQRHPIAATSWHSRRAAESFACLGTARLRISVQRWRHCRLKPVCLRTGCRPRRSSNSWVRLCSFLFPHGKRLRQAELRAHTHLQNCAGTAAHACSCSGTCWRGLGWQQLDHGEDQTSI